jgi:hypothetical protein
MFRRILILCCILCVALTQTGCSRSFMSYLRDEYSGDDGGVVAVSTGPYNQKGYDRWTVDVDNVASNKRAMYFSSLGSNLFAFTPDFENSNKEGGTIILRRLAPGTYRVSGVWVKHGKGIYCDIVPGEQIEFTIKPNQIKYIGSYWLRIVLTEEERVVDSKVSVFGGLYTKEGSRPVTFLVHDYSLEITDEWERDRTVVEKDSPELMTMIVNKQVHTPGSGNSTYEVGNCSLLRTWELFH